MPLTDITVGHVLTSLASMVVTYLIILSAGAVSLPNCKLFSIDVSVSISLPKNL